MLLGFSLFQQPLQLLLISAALFSKTFKPIRCRYFSTVMAFKRATSKTINTWDVSHNLSQLLRQTLSTSQSQSRLVRKCIKKMPASHTDSYEDDVSEDKKCEQIRGYSSCSQQRNGNNNSNVKLSSSSQDLSAKRKLGDDFVTEAVPRLLNKVLATYKDRDR